MLDWFKRRTAGAPREQLGENENRAVSTEEKVERLVCRLGTNRKPGDELAAESLDPGAAPAPAPDIAPAADIAPPADVAPISEHAPVAAVGPAPDLAGLRGRGDSSRGS